MVVAPQTFTDKVCAPLTWARRGDWIDESLGADFVWPRRFCRQDEVPGWHEPCFRFGTDRLGCSADNLALFRESSCVGLSAGGRQ